LVSYWGLGYCSGDKMDMIYDDGSEERELVMIAKAIDEAMRKFNEVIEAEGYDPCYYDFTIEVRVLDATMSEVLYKVKYEDVNK